MPDVRLIDANALLKTLSDLEYECINQKQKAACNAVLHDFMPQIINDEPTIEAQPVKHGKWERIDMFVKCSECGVELLEDAFFGIHVFDDGYMPFCPNCGRRMTY